MRDYCNGMPWVRDMSIVTLLGLNLNLCSSPRHDSSCDSNNPTWYKTESCCQNRQAWYSSSQCGDVVMELLPLLTRFCRAQCSLQQGSCSAGTHTRW
jgi:hypothetical protein